MPRDPRDTTLTAPEQQARKLLDADENARLGGRSYGNAVAGAEGKEGAAGKNGATWYSGTTVPSTGLGVVGDFYLRTTTSDVYKKTGEVAWSLEVNIKGATGSAGTNGSTWFSGAAAPEVGTGSNGDYYFRTETDDVYKKEAGTWSVVANLKGASGKEGPAGSTANNDWKNSVRAATTANVTISTALNPTDVLDGVTLAENDRVLVKNQTTKSENGIWIVKAVPVRAEDADAVAELSGGSTIYVEEGTRNKQRTFQIITPGNITPGTTAHEYKQLGVRDFGLVAALPTSEAVVGDLCTYKAVSGEVFWQFVYDGEGEHPWKYIGGAPLYNEVATEEATSSAAFTGLATAGPSVTAPLKGIFDLDIGFYGVQKTGGTAAALRMSYKIGAAAALEEDKISVIAQAGFGSAAGMRPRRRTVVAAATTFLAQYSVSAGENTFLNRWMRLTPVRVG